MSAEAPRANIRPNIRVLAHLRGEYEQIRYLPRESLQPTLDQAVSFDLWRSRIGTITNTAIIIEVFDQALTRTQDPKLVIGGAIALCLANLYLWAKSGRVQMIQDEISSRSLEESTSPDLI